MVTPIRVATKTAPKNKEGDKTVETGASSSSLALIENSQGKCKSLMNRKGKRGGGKGSSKDTIFNVTLDGAYWKHPNSGERDKNEA